MNTTITIGPLALPLGMLLLAVAAILALLTGNRLARRAGVEIEGDLYRILLVSLLVARVAFVLQYPDPYYAAPWTILDIRDGGWEAGAGLVAAWFQAGVLARREPTLRKPLLSAVAVASAVWLAGTVFTLLPAPGETPLPRFTAHSIDGEPVDLAAYAGKPTVINLWASWCGPCRREMPVFARAQHEHPGVEFVFLNQGEATATVRRFLDDNRLGLRNVLLDPKAEVGRAFQQRALPTTLFFDATGHLVDIRVGALSDATLMQRVTPLLRTATPPGPSDAPDR